MAVEFIRQTLTKTAEFVGNGLHSGVPVIVRVEPGSQGINFHCGGESVRASPNNVTDTSRCTKLGSVSTVEHIMSAFAGLGITDADVVLSASELPALSGGSDDYANQFLLQGIEAIGHAEFSLFERVFIVEGDVRVGISKGDGHWRYDFECGDRWPNEMSYECHLSLSLYADEIAPSRTFAFEEEIEPILRAGLAKGLNLETALIIGKDGFNNEAKWPDEPSRHKMLDLIGDLFLVGIPPELLNVVAVRSGHRTNVAAAMRLKEHVKIAT